MKKQISPYHSVLFFLLFSVLTQAQSITDTIIAHQHFVKGDTLNLKGNYKEAIVAFEIAANEFKSNEVWKRYIESLNEISYNFYRLGKLDKSLESANLALQTCKNKLQAGSLFEATAIKDIAKVYRKQNKHTDALQFYKEALAITEKKAGSNDIKTANLCTHIGILYDDNLGFIEEAKQYYLKSLEINKKLYDLKKENNLDGTYLNLAILYSRNGLYHQAQPYYEKAIQLSKEIYGENTPYIAEYYYNFASNYGYIGEDHLALQYFKKGLNIIKDTHDNNDGVLGFFYDGIGTQYSRIKELDLAYKNYQKSLKIYEKTYGENDLSTANVLSNIAYGVFLQKGNYDLAFDYYKKSYTIRKKLFGEEHRNTFKLNQDFGELYEEQGKYDIAENYYTQHLELAIKSFGRKNQKTAECYIDKARIYFKKKQYLNAIQEYQNAVIAGTRIFNNTSIYSNPSSKDYINPSTLLVAFHGKAKALNFLGKEKKDQKILQASFLSFKSCDSLIDHTRNSFLLVEDKTLLGQAKSSQIYTDAIDNALELHKTTNNRDYLSDAFYFSEKNKARLLEEQLKKIKAQSFANIPEEKLEIIEKLNAQLSFYKSKVYQAENSKEKPLDSAIHRYTNLVFTNTQKIDSTLNILEKDYPKYHQLKYDNSIVSIQIIQKKLETDTALLEYFVTDKVIYAFLITKNDFYIKEIIIDNLEDKIIQFRNAILSKDLTTYKRMGAELYQKLIDPFAIESNIHNMIIVPDGLLWHLNFDLLITQKTKSNNPKKIPYLLKDKVISYANSANLFFSKQFTKSATQRKCLAFSFSDTQFSKSKTPISNAVIPSTTHDLPGTRKEIEAISKIINGKYYYGEEAIESNFKSEVNRYALVHLALHGEIDDKNPENSKLFFMQIKDSIEDNYLYNHELYALNIPAELAVLSACNTGSGKISKGEGIMSLGRAFQYAGTQSLLLTNWAVSDETTPDLMKYFYDNLKQGMTKPKALQQAKLQYLNDANVFRADPFFWGGFYLIGDTNPIDLGNEKTYLYFVLLACILIALAFLFLKNRFKKH
ncbi:CHAT domain-containing protein [Aquimarina mytili]|uniref:CHAT domain-containing protein n=1 Tax=Aquimarina mytili TaxID=874423 RepID=A0A936ZZX2_9FLAO|nr:CHAT domain-containing tetratricopeptide repeat protein [Aquimarina mytili]MBL0685446.1 CHAT domain-containing protein [Aquimarina mytili]